VLVKHLLEDGGLLVPRRDVALLEDDGGGRVLGCYLGRCLRPCLRVDVQDGDSVALRCEVAAHGQAYAACTACDDDGFGLMIRRGGGGLGGHCFLYLGG